MPLTLIQLYQELTNYMNVSTGTVCNIYKCGLSTGISGIFLKSSI